MNPRSGFFRTNWNDRFEAIRSQSLATYTHSKPASKRPVANRGVKVIRACVAAVERGRPNITEVR